MNTLLDYPKILYYGTELILLKIEILACQLMILARNHPKVSQSPLNNGLSVK